MNLLYENSWILFLQRIWMLFCRQWTWPDSTCFACGEQQLKSQLLLLFLSPAELIGVCLIHTMVQWQLGMWAEIAHRLQDPSLGLSFFSWILLLFLGSVDWFAESSVQYNSSLCPGVSVGLSHTETVIYPQDKVWNIERLPSAAYCLLSFNSSLKHTCFYLFSRTLC